MRYTVSARSKTCSPIAASPGPITPEPMRPAWRRPKPKSARSFRGLLFVNLVDCDQLFGHRRNPNGYAAALEAIDAWLPKLVAGMGEGDALFITGDHGTDPTYRGTDHTREAVPLLGIRQAYASRCDLGARRSFADLGATLAEAFHVGPLESGTSFAGDIGLASREG